MYLISYADCIELYIKQSKRRIAQRKAKHKNNNSDQAKYGFNKEKKTTAQRLASKKIRL